MDDRLEETNGGECLGDSAVFGDPLDPRGPARPIAEGALADLVRCRGTLADVLADLTAERVAATIVAGKVAFSR